MQLLPTAQLRPSPRPAIRCGAVPLLSGRHLTLFPRLHRAQRATDWKGLAGAAAVPGPPCSGPWLRHVGYLVLCWLVLTWWGQVYVLTLAESGGHWAEVWVAGRGCQSCV